MKSTCDVESQAESKQSVPVQKQSTEKHQPILYFLC